MKKILLFFISFRKKIEQLVLKGKDFDEESKRYKVMLKINLLKKFI